MLAPAHVLTAAMVAAGTGADPTAALLTAAAALMPDVDEPGSTVGRALFFISWPLRFIFGHRGVTHSLFSLTASTLLVDVFLNWALARFWALGYASHLFLDMLTSPGIPLFWPYPRHYGLPLGRSGGLIELAYTAALIYFLLAIPWGRQAIARFF